MPTWPVDHFCWRAQSTAATTSACSPGPPQSWQPLDPPVIGPLDGKRVQREELLDRQGLTPDIPC